MILPGYVGQRDIAQRAGVHITTVSLALRDSPRLPEATRQRIRSIAEEMGYRPDPMLSALTIYRERIKRVRHQGTLAWIGPVFRKGQPWSGFKEYRKGGEERCAELGYQMEEFRLSELSSGRLSKILKARNIQGLIIPPQSFSRAHINFDWENFSAVCFGYTLSRPRLHLVSNAQYRSARIAVRALRAHGYRRIAFVTTRVNDERTDQNFSSGFLSEQRRFRPEDQVPMLILDDGPRVDELPQFKKWYQRYKPEVVIYHYPPVADYFALLGVGPETCGWASLSLASTDGSLAGVCQNDLLIGRAAVDFLIGMIHRNERGIPETRSQLLIDGTWIDGATVLPKKDLMSLPKPNPTPEPKAEEAISPKPKPTRRRVAAK
ncbi:LacI family transcriptional regulator, repressor for deo operon, udp, cdd, tsx, nupC, and nupG [Verrucomicrobium sp. GAS474]|uniref:LacI family DNA-binding transcriptional regulator n=1 Tax=Verrucomicrobium sp. GAS474 TaxID=1882831 RepID=UPI00087C94E4|nr:LacI family DNA-binding transcriptional regulator [Verrucomicrobium sp. GAS474]SDT88650.1 LacI family transcriptional regulator, repressor for deo operon, udp, cdd, tsx, nupC, and nupG [Verrucomicrobium sp. GAS474]